MAYKVGVMGAAGFAGVELVRLLAQHPQFELIAVTSDADAGKEIAETYPAFTGMDMPKFTNHDDPILFECDLVFLAVPHTVALKYAPTLLDKGVTVIDLSADFRLKDPDVYEKWYGVEHTATDLLANTKFGLPEVVRDEIAAAAADFAAGKPVLVSCAGCYPTATSLASFPAIQAGLSAGLIVVDAISGVTGAGKKASARTHYCFADENLEAYGLANHRHTPEIEQILGVSGENRLVFTPHLAPLKRGILSTVTLSVPEGVNISAEALQELYEGFYAESPMVEVLPAGTSPKTTSVTGTVKAQVSATLAANGRAIICLGAIDNLCKGAAGQAVQCANIVVGLPQATGLPTLALPI
ncbi:MAG: N-acetyl-gamma-glutamyl-phosphate reductase [Coriobacteriia bacterium]|nr:N-acetyl-gamma-glutamyl-phosphate reductase [Coriobacteriia bacterium]